MPHRYVIVGGGVAAAAAIEGIRSQDTGSPILLLTREHHLPYRRTLLSKEVGGREGGPKLDFDALSIHADDWYASQGVEMLVRREVVELDPDRLLLWDERGERHEFVDLLIATGCRPRRPNAEGAESSLRRYFPHLQDC